MASSPREASTFQVYCLSALLTAGKQVSDQHVQGYWDNWRKHTSKLLSLDSQGVGVLAAEELDVDGAVGVGSRVLPLDDVGLAGRDLLVLVGGVDLGEAGGGIDADGESRGGKGQDGSNGEAHLVWLVWRLVGKRRGLIGEVGGGGGTGEVYFNKYRAVF